MKRVSKLFEKEKKYQGIASISSVMFEITSGNRPGLHTFNLIMAKICGYFMFGLLITGTRFSGD